jgi:lysozyme family protein
VNSGVATAVRKLQAAVGVADDGHWGPMSAKALAAMEVNDVLMRFMAQRLRYWVRCSAWPTMGAGWINRAAGQLDYAAMDN